MNLPDRKHSRLALRSRLLRRLTRWMVAASFTAIPLASFAGVFVSISIAPPPLPIYAQPIMPGPGYIWTPGYWSYADDGYFWVPGTWVLVPFQGALWTPGYWGWNGGFYAFHGGYWGPRVGFYGGINYGFGYVGVGYAGGYWRNGAFNYNRTVNNINVTKVTNVYNKTIINNNTTINRSSYNGGSGGVSARPTTQEQLATRDKHTQPIAAQQQQVRMASQNRALRASVNHGAPAIAATPRAGVFSGQGVVRARPASAAMVNAGPAQAANASAPRAAHLDRRPGSQANVNAPRSANFAPRNHGAERPMQASRATSSPQGPSRPAGEYPRPMRQAPAYHQAPRAYQPPQPRPHPHPQAQPHRQPANGGNHEERKPSN